MVDVFVASLVVDGKFVLMELSISTSQLVVGLLGTAVKLTMGRGIRAGGIDIEGVTPFGDVSIETMGLETDMNVTEDL